MHSQITKSQVKHVADLANIPISDEEASELTDALIETLATIDNLSQVDTTNVEPVHQVTGMENVTRSDTVDEQRMFSQQEAVANATHTHQGYFVVPQVLNK